MGFFTGKIMEATAGKANGKDVAAELRRRRRLGVERFFHVTVERRADPTPDLLG